MPNAESKQPHASHGAEQSLRNSEPSEVRGVREINGQLTITGTENVLAQLCLIARENLDAFTPARNCHVPLLPVCRWSDGGVGEKNVVHGLPL
jgi:hypothetical protein